MQHTLIIRHLTTDSTTCQFIVQRQTDGSQADPCQLTAPENITVEGRPTSNLRHDLRWYLEHFLDYPLAPNTEIAERVQAALETWGKTCFKQLFNGRARDWYQDAYRDGLAQLTLKIASDDPSVLAWPWEALHDPEGHALAPTCHIARQLNALHDPLPLPPNLATDQINLLLIIARPYDNDVGYHALSRPIVEQVTQHHWPVHIDVLRPPTLTQLRDVLHAKPGFYHLVHFDGHGGYGNTVSSTGPQAFQSPQGQLIFEDDGGNAQPVEANVLSTLLAEHRVPIMVLNACQSAAIDDDAQDPFASVAAALLKAGVRSVVAMGYNLYVSAAQAFIPAFYQRLLEQGDLADAVRAGRQQMLAQNLRICRVGTAPLQDWLVPVLYQQTPYTLPVKQALAAAPKQTPTTDPLPDAATASGDYGFIGRERAIQALEAASLRQAQAGILIHGMAGVGKTTLTQGFLQWLRDTHGLQGPVLWFSFDDIRSAEYVINRLVEALLSLDTTAYPMTQKLPALVQALRDNPCWVIWDNFESSAELTEDDRGLLKTLLKDLRGGRSKILITSRASEQWLTQTECYRLPLRGLQGDERWAYCEAVVCDLGLKIDRGKAVYSELMEELAGHPLAMRAVLLRLAETSAEALLEALKTAFVGADGDESTRRIFAALHLLDQGLPTAFTPVLQLIGLHQRFVDQNYIEAMLEHAEVTLESEAVPGCFLALERGGLLHPQGQNIYSMHPALTHYCAQQHVTNDALKRGFVGVMGWLAGHFTAKSLHEQRGPFTLHSANFYHAQTLAQALPLWDDFSALTQGLAMYSLNLQDFSTAKTLFTALATHEAAAEDQTRVAGAYHQLGMIVEEQHDYAAAEAWYQKSLTIEEKLGNQHGTATSYHQLGIIALKQRDYAAAEAWYQKSLAIDEKQGNQHGAALTYGQLGRLAAKQNETLTAATWYLKAITRFRHTNDPHHLNMAISDYLHLLKNSHDTHRAELTQRWQAANLALPPLEELEKNITQSAQQSNHHPRYPRLKTLCIRLFSTVKQWFR